MSGDRTADEKWSRYAQTVLEFYAAPPASVDLRRPVGGDERAALLRVGLAGEFAVLTAENPAGQHAEDASAPGEAARAEARNARRTRTLVAELDRLGVPYVRVDGVSPDGAYRERCVAALAPRGDAVALARDYAQLALFWFDGSRFWLLPADADKTPEPLPLDGRSRP
jgi:hypothetical protein